MDAPIVEAVKAAAVGHSGPVLDVGCGEGYYAVRVAEHLGAELTGLDISKEAVRCAAAQYKGQPNIGIYIVIPNT